MIMKQQMVYIWFKNKKTDAITQTCQNFLERIA